MAEPTTAHGVEVPQREDWELQRDACKLQGDTAFRSGNFQEAIRHYSAGLALDPKNHLLLSNRSAAHLKVSNKSKALQDAKACISSKPDFVKGYSRLASAEQSLGRWKDARDNYNMVLEKDPQNAAAKKGLEECDKQLALKEEEEKRILASQEEMKQESSQKKAASEDDLLDDFFAEVETAAAKPKVSVVEDERKDAIKNQKASLGTAASQIDRLLAPNYKWRNLNPFFVLDIPHTSTEEEISRRYKALSLLLHPDKCRDLDKAKEAYDEIQKAKLALSNENKRNHVQQLVEQGHRVGKHKWHTGDKSKGLSLQEVQSREVQRIFAQIEHKRMAVEKNERKQEQRERDQEEEELHKERKEREFNTNWRQDGRVEKRIGSWRQFQNKKKPKV